MASSGDYAETKFNLAAQGARQPGSSFKIVRADDGVAPRREPEQHALHVGVADAHRRPAVRRAVRHQDLRRHERRQHEPLPGDAAVRQLGLHPARARPRAGQGGRHRRRHGHQAPARQGLSGRVARRPRGRRVAARDGDRVRHDRLRRLPQPADRDHQGRVRGHGQVRAAAALAAAPHEGLPGRRDLRGDQDPPGEHPGRHRRARRTSAARRAARPAPPTSTPTPGSSASRRASRRPCGSATRTTAPR